MPEGCCQQQRQHEEQDPWSGATGSVATVRGAGAAVDGFYVGRCLVIGALVRRVVHVLVKTGTRNHPLAVD